MTEVTRLSTLSAEQRHDVAQMLDAAQSADGVAALSEQAVLAVAHRPDVEHYLAAGARGYANVLPGRDANRLPQRSSRSGTLAGGGALIDACAKRTPGCASGRTVTCRRHAPSPRRPA